VLDPVGLKGGVDEDVGIKADHHRLCISSRVKVRRAAPQGSSCAITSIALETKYTYKLLFFEMEKRFTRLYRALPLRRPSPSRREHRNGARQALAAKKRSRSYRDRRTSEKTRAQNKVWASRRTSIDTPHPLFIYVSEDAL
jgi:hypothetical protein